MKRRYDYDVLRVLSMLGVIYLHTAAGTLQAPGHAAVWNFSNVIVAFATAAVPLFFMMSGALLLGSDSTADVRSLFRHRLPKVAIPLAVWSAVVLVYQLVSAGFDTVVSSLSQILSAPVVTPYWFLYALIPMYLLSPFLKKMTDTLTRQHWNYLILLWLVLTLGLSTVRGFLPFRWEVVFTEHWRLNVNVVGGYLGYFMLGAYLERLERIPPKKVLAGVIALMVLVSIVGTHYVTYKNMAYTERFTGYLTLFTAILSAAIFLLAKSCLGNKEEKGRLLPLLSGISFAVYLLHPLALGAVSRVWCHFSGLNDPVTIPQQLLVYLCVVICCVAGAVILASIKPLCYIFTGQSFAAACKSCNLFALFSGKSKQEG